MNIILNTWTNYDCTIGRLTCGQFQCFTLELPWKRNKKDVSCIPAGDYETIRYFSPALQREVLLFRHVPGRSLIEVHAGNYTREIRGCILVGDGIKYLDKDTIPDVTNSKNTLEKLLNYLPPSESHSIKIIRNGAAI